MIKAKYTSEFLIPRKKLFHDNVKYEVLLSASGQYVSYLTSGEDKVQLWVAPTNDPEKVVQLVQIDIANFIGYSWVNTDEYLIYWCKKDDDLCHDIYKVNINKSNKIKLQFKEISLQIISDKTNISGQIPVMVFSCFNQVGDVYILNTSTMKLNILYENAEQFEGFVCDSHLKLIFAYRYNKDGIIDFYHFQGNHWEKYKLNHIEKMQILEFAKNNESVYILDAVSHNTKSLYNINIKNNKHVCILRHNKADFDGDMLIDPVNKNLQAVAINYIRKLWCIFDSSLNDDFQTLSKIESGDIHIKCRTMQDSLWLVEYTQDCSPPLYYLFNRKTQTANFLFSANCSLAEHTLSPMNAHIISSCDNLELLSYYTLPSNNSDSYFPYKPLPTVMLVHEGPWKRDRWKCARVHQWLSNRGYAVICVNFRSSTGFGKSFSDCGRREWGRKMQDDLVDTVQYYINIGISDPNHIAIMGKCYGGYATLMGLALNSDLFTCGIAFGGALHLCTLLDSVPPHFSELLFLHIQNIGDNQTEEGRRLLAQYSPIELIDGIQKPLLIGYYNNDKRVLQKERDKLIYTLNRKNIPVTYVQFIDEVEKTLNKRAFFAVAEAFLALHLGGRTEPIGDEFENSSITIPFGADDIPDIQKAIDKHTIAFFEQFVEGVE